MEKQGKRTYKLTKNEYQLFIKIKEAEEKARRKAEEEARRKAEEEARRKAELEKQELQKLLEKKAADKAAAEKAQACQDRLTILNQLQNQNKI